LQRRRCRPPPMAITGGPSCLHGLQTVNFGPLTHTPEASAGRSICADVRLAPISKPHLAGLGAALAAILTHCRRHSKLRASPNLTLRRGRKFEAGVLSDTWERVLHGSSGDVFTEPHVFKELIGPLIDQPGDEVEGCLRFERVSADDDNEVIILYVPGIDFAGMLGSSQFRGLASLGMQLWRCYVGPEDRSPFAVLVDSLSKWVVRQSQGGRKVVLVGESFGGLLALAVACRVGSSLHGLALVNPATSFDKTPWALLARSLVTLPSGDELPPIRPTDDIDELLSQISDRIVNDPYAYTGAFGLIATVMDQSQLARVFSRVTDETLSSRSTNEASSEPNRLLQSFLTYPMELAKFLSQETVRFRLRYWLRDGCEVVNSELRTRSANRQLPPTLLVCGDGDRLLPSAAEGQRLKTLLEPACGKGLLKLVEIKNAGHALLDPTFDLAALLQSSPIFKPLPRPKNYVKDYKTPTLEKLEEASANIETLASIFSPVFCSTDPRDGQRCFGLGGIPDPDASGRPILFVGNHQLIALDLAPLIREFLIEKGFAPRGLAHPTNFPELISDTVKQADVPKSSSSLLDAFGLPFELRSAIQASSQALWSLLQGDRGEGTQENSGTEQNPDEQQAVEPGLFGVPNFWDWGAVPVKPRTFYQLLQRGDPVLLFPGGALEACSRPNDKYKLFWPRKTDFVRAAARFNALVVPFGGVGVADGFRNAPEVGILRKLGASGPEAPNSQNWQGQEEGMFPVSEALQAPIGFPEDVVPRLQPATQAAAGFGDRIYYSFGSPVDLKDLNPKDKEACAETYKEIKNAVEGEISWLLEARVKDPFRDFLKRQAYERIADLDRRPREVKAGPSKGGMIRNYGARAPSFPLDRAEH